MSVYTPDRWVVLKLVNEGKTFYKVLAGWSGGYLDGDSWRMNSGITNFTQEDDYYCFSGMSGSVYRCHKKGYGTNSLSHNVWANMYKRFPDQVIMLPEATDWSSMEWGI